MNFGKEWIHTLFCGTLFGFIWKLTARFRIRCRNLMIKGNPYRKSIEQRTKCNLDFKYRRYHSCNCFKRSSSITYTGIELWPVVDAPFFVAEPITTATEAPKFLASCPWVSTLNLILQTAIEFSASATLSLFWLTPDCAYSSTSCKARFYYRLRFFQPSKLCETVRRCFQLFPCYSHPHFWATILPPSTICTSAKYDHLEYSPHNDLSLQNVWALAVGKITIYIRSLGLASHVVFRIQGNGILWMELFRMTVLLWTESPDILLKFLEYLTRRGTFDLVGVFRSTARQSDLEGLPPVSFNWGLGKVFIFSLLFIVPLSSFPIR